MFTASVRSLASRQPEGTYRYHCPACSAQRRNTHDRPLSVTNDAADHLTYLCHHCGLKGGCDMTEPVPFVAIKSSPAADDGANIGFNYLASRGITRPTVLAAGVVYEPEHQFRDGPARAIGFPYLKDGKPYAMKWRGIDAKQFNQTGAAATLWGIERIVPGTPLIACEGEVDALSFWQAGIPAVSVPNGAPQQVSERRSSPMEDKKFSYIWAAKEQIDAASKIIVATDDDGPGEALAEEIARRVGRARCWRVTWPEGIKDANAMLCAEGVAGLRRVTDEAAPWPVKGLYETAHFLDRVTALYDRGLPRGESTGYPLVDGIYTVAPGQLSIVTGTPGSGKSTFIDNVAVNIAKAKGWKFAVCSFENPPDIHIAKLAAIYANKPFFDGLTPRMTKPERDVAIDWVHNHFFFLHQADGSLSQMSDILDLGRAAIMRYGVRGLICDPYNFISRDPNMTETDWVSDMLTKLKVFSIGHDLHVFLCAHPSKLRRRDDGSYPVPTGMDIAGSAHFWNKADMGLTVHRPNPKTDVCQIVCWKTRFAWCGQVGDAEIMYDRPTGSYYEATAATTWAAPPASPRRTWEIN